MAAGMELSEGLSEQLAGPRLAVLAVVLRRSARGPQVLLVRRANPPQAGHWGFPGGKVKWGEDLGSAALRELREETGIAAGAPRVIGAIDLLDSDDHHLMIAVQMTWLAGEPRAGDDALEAHWSATDSLPHPLCADVDRVIAAALRAQS